MLVNILVLLRGYIQIHTQINLGLLTKSNGYYTDVKWNG